MRTYPAAFEAEHNKSSKSPVYLLKQYLDDEQTIAAYFTSSELCELPPGIVRPEDYVGPSLLNVLTTYIYLPGETVSRTVNGYFGITTVMSDDGLTLMVGSHNFNATINGPGLGGVDIFTRSEAGIPFVFSYRIKADVSDTYWTEFGYCSTMSGDGRHIAVSAPGATAGSGNVRTYDVDDAGVWYLTGLHSVGLNLDRAGESLSYSYDGSVLAVGLAFYDPLSGAAASGRVVLIEGGTTYNASIDSPDGTTNYKFGNTVKISGDGSVLYVGALKADNSGIVYRYDRAGTYWAVSEPVSTSVQGPTPTINYYFGSTALAAKTPIACSYDGAVVVVGESAGLNQAASGVGVVHVYSSSATLMTLVETVEAPLGFTSAAMEFGGSVHLTPDGSTLSVGADLFVNPTTLTATGGVNIFKRINSVYTFDQQVTSSELIADSRVGYSVSLSAAALSLSIGMPYTNYSGFTNAGSDEVYKLGRDYVFEATVLNPQGVFQGIDRLSGTSTLGSISVSLIDYGGELTTFFAEKLVEGYGLRDKVAEFYRGYPGIAFADYVKFGTQKVDIATQGKKGLIDLSYIEISHSTKSAIFEVAGTNLSADMTLTDTVVECYNTVPFGQVEHGPQYKDAPTYTTGTISIATSSAVVTGVGTSWLSARAGKDSRIEIEGQSFYVALIISDTELILNRPIPGTIYTPQSGLSYALFPVLIYLQLEDELMSATDRVLQVVSNTSVSYGFATDAGGYHITGMAEAAQYPMGCRIKIVGSTSNSGSFITHRNDVANKLYITGTFTVEGAGPAVNILADVQFCNLTRGVRGSVPSVHTISIGALPSRQPKITELAYLTMPGPMMALALLSGVVRNQSAIAVDTILLPYTYHLGINARFIDHASFENAGDDLWNLTDQSGVIFEFFMREKEEGKRFLETEIYRILGAVTFVSDDGKITYKQLNSILFDSATVGTLNKDNAKFDTITHDMPKLANRYVFDWDFDPVTEKPRERDQLVDLSSSAVHGLNKILHYKMRGINRDIYTKQFIYSRFDALRDGYAGPPVLKTLQALPSQDKYQVGDVVFVESEDVRDFTNPITGTLARAMEVEKVSIDFPTGRLNYDFFGSSRKSELIINQLSDFALLDSFYSVAGGRNAALKLDVVAGLTTSVDAQGTLHITAAAVGVNLPGHATDGSNAEYWYDGPVTIDPGVTVTVDLNARLFVMGVLYISSTGKLDGSGGNSTGVPGYIGVALGGGGLYYDYAGGFKIDGSLRLLSTANTIARGSVSALPYFEVNSVGGTTLSGLPKNLVGVKGSPGGGVFHKYTSGTNPPGEYVALGGSAGAAGSGLVILSRGIIVAYGGVIDLSGLDGLSGGIDPERGFHAGTGAGGSSGSLLVLLDGKGSYAVGMESSFVANSGAAPVTGTPRSSPVLESNLTYSETSDAYSYFVGNYNKISRSQSNLRIQRLPDPV